MKSGIWQFLGYGLFIFIIVRIFDDKSVESAFWYACGVMALCFLVDLWKEDVKEEIKKELSP